MKIRYSFVFIIALAVIFPAVSFGEPVHAQDTSVTSTTEVQASQKPAKVRKLKVKNKKKRAATLRWQASDRASYYKVQLLASDKKTVLKRWKNHKNNKKKIKKKHKHLKAGTVYYYRVKACNSAGCSKWSKRKKFKTKEKESTQDSSDTKNENVDSDILALESEVFDLINDYRESKGLSRLTANADIAAIAREHSTNMANGTVAFGHDGFSDDRFPRMLELVHGSGSGAENVAWATDRDQLAEVIAQGWIDSDGHRANIERSIYTQSGMGIAAVEGRYFFTQLFLTD